MENCGQDRVFLFSKFHLRPFAGLFDNPADNVDNAGSLCYRAHLIFEKR